MFFHVSLSFLHDLNIIVHQFLQLPCIKCLAFGLIRIIVLSQDRPSTKVHAAPGGGSSLGYLFGGGSN